MCHCYWKGATPKGITYFFHFQNCSFHWSGRFCWGHDFCQNLGCLQCTLENNQFGITWNQCWVSATSTGWWILKRYVPIHYKLFIYIDMYSRTFDIDTKNDGLENVSPFKSGYFCVSMLKFGSYICLFQSYLLRTFLHPKEKCIDSCRQMYTHYVFLCLSWLGLIWFLCLLHCWWMYWSSDDLVVQDMHWSWEACHNLQERTRQKIFG